MKPKIVNVVVEQELVNELKARTPWITGARALIAHHLREHVQLCAIPQVRRIPRRKASGN